MFVLTRFHCVFSHLVASAHRELPVKGSPAAVAQVNTGLSSCVYHRTEMMLTVCFSSGPTVSVQCRPVSSGQWDEDSGYYAG